MTTDNDSGAMSRQEWVVIASFANRRAAEHMLASLGRNFRRRANKGQAEAFLITGNADGSLKLGKSRVLERVVSLPPSLGSRRSSWSD